MDIGEYIDALVLSLVSKTINHVASISELLSDLKNLKCHFKKAAEFNNKDFLSPDPPKIESLNDPLTNSPSPIISLRDLSLMADNIFEAANNLNQEISAISEDINEIMGSVEDMIEARLKSDTENRAKSSFLARISHEIRSPMNAIIGMTELAERSWGKLDGLEYIKDAKKAGANLLALINEILDYSKMESGIFEFAEEPYSTGSMLNDVLTITRVHLGEKPVKFTSEIDESLPSLMIGDEVRIRQMLLQLLLNAVKFTKSGTIKFTVGFTPLEAESVKLLFTVSDTGVGVRPEDMAGIFDGFSKLDVARNGYLEGVGLGLKIASNISRRLGGDISVTSEYERGSTFTATVIQKVADRKPIGPQNQSPLTLVNLLARFQAPGFRVLVVDDMESNLKVAEGLLSPYEMEVTTCESGEKALGLVRQKPFDLIFMDHMMPGLNGLEATAAIRSLGGRYKDLPIVALTANAISGMKEVFLKNGFSDFLSKPIEVVKLDYLLKKWIPVEKRRKPPQNLLEKSSEIAQTGFVLPEIKGLNSAEGLIMAGRSPRLYLEILRLFLRDVEGYLPNLENEPTDSSMNRFITVVHALKSALANIGAKDLSAAAGILENAGRDGNLDLIKNNLTFFRLSLIEITTQININLTNIKNQRKIQYSLSEKEALKALQNALISRDVDAIDSSLAKFQAQTLTSILPETVSEIADLILLADFSQAQEVIAGLLGQG